jgi:adenylate cyclase
MATEIERKFLVTGDSWRNAVESEARLMQGYLANNANVTVRVRIKGNKAMLTIKGATLGVTRAEYEYAIPMDDADTMLKELATGPVVDKTRYLVRVDDHVWELDVFHGDNDGLVMAEIELGSEDEAFRLPDWAGEEVSHDSRYYNVNLARNPYKHW